MNKRNILFLAIIIATLITAAIRFIPALDRANTLALVYFPSILLAVLFAGNSHSPSELAGWTSFVSYTLLYDIIFIVTYAVLWELYLVHKSLRDLDRASSATRDQLDADETLKRLGQALAQIETRRRKSFLLKPMDLPDLSGDPAQLAAQALRHARDQRAVKSALRVLGAQLKKKHGAEAAERIMDAMHQQATAISN
jgi:hypothetical protein